MVERRYKSPPATAGPSRPRARALEVVRLRQPGSVVVRLSGRCIPAWTACRNRFRNQILHCAAPGDPVYESSAVRRPHNSIRPGPPSRGSSPVAASKAYGTQRPHGHNSASSVAVQAPRPSPLRTHYAFATSVRDRISATNLPSRLIDIRAVRARRMIQPLAIRKPANWRHVNRTAGGTLHAALPPLPSVPHTVLPGLRPIARRLSRRTRGRAPQKQWRESLMSPWF